MTARDYPDDAPTRAELAGEPPVTGVPLPWDGTVPDHAAFFGDGCGVPASRHLSAADLDRADRGREGL